MASGDNSPSLTSRNEADDDAEPPTPQKRSPNWAMPETRVLLTLLNGRREEMKRMDKQKSISVKTTFWRNVAKDLAKTNRESNRDGKACRVRWKTLTKSAKV